MPKPIPNRPPHPIRRDLALGLAAFVATVLAILTDGAALAPLPFA